MMYKRGSRILSVLLSLVLLVGMLPVFAADVQMAETELNKLVGYHATTADPERQGAVTPAAQVADQTQSVTLDAKAGMLSLDFGTAAFVTRLELISANAATELTADDIEVWLGTENFGKVKFFEDGTNETRAQLSKLSKQDYRIAVEQRDGHAVLNFRFFGNAAGRYLVVQVKNPTVAANFVLEQMGRDVRAYGELAVVNEPAVNATQLHIRPDTVTGDSGDAALPQLGEGAWTAFDRKGASIVLDMGQIMAIDKITLRAADEAAEIPDGAVLVCISSDGATYTLADSFVMTQAVVDGRRELTFSVEEAVQGRYLKLHYAEDGAEAFEILNTEEDILVGYDPFGLPDSDPERREAYSIAVSTAYFDSRLVGEYGQEALDKRNELSVEEYVIWYLDNLNSNFNYLYRWENIGEQYAADNVNISAAVKLPAKGPVDQIVITATGAANIRLLPEDWIISWSNDNRNFTVIDHDTMTFRETTIEGRTAHVIDFPEVEAKTFLVYNTYTKNFTALPSGKSWFVVKGNQEHYAAYNKVDASTRYTAAPIAVEMITGDTLELSGVKTGMLLDLEENVEVLALSMTPKAGTVLAAENFILQAWNGEQWTDIAWTAAEQDGDHIFTMSEAAETRYLRMQYTGVVTGADYFAENYSNIVLTVKDAGEAVSLADGLTKRGFAYNAGYITGANGMTAAEIWALIEAEPDPVSAYQVAQECGLGIGWTYRIADQYVLDTPQLRQSVMFYWSEVKELNRLTIASNQTRTDIRVTENDFYVAYSTDNFSSYTLLEPADLTVTAYTTEGGCPGFVLDLPETVRASHVIVYTTYSLGELSDPTASGYYYFIILPTDGNLDAFLVPNTREVTPQVTALESGYDPFAASKTDVLLDLGDTVSVDKVVLTPAAELELVEEDYEIQVWDGSSWNTVEWTAKAGTNHVFSLSEAAETRYVRLHYKGLYDGNAYFSDTYSDITVTLTATGDTTVLTDGMTSRTFAPGASYLPTGIDQAAVWAAIQAEPDPVKGYQVALKNGVSIGWAYRTSTRTAIDHHNVRQSIMFYWADAKNLSRIYVPTDNAATNLRVTTDDFYVAYSNDNFTTYETFAPGDLTVTQTTTADGYPAFTIDLPQVIKARYVIVYTSYNLETLSNPSDTGHTYFIVVPTQVEPYLAPVGETVIPALTDLEAGEDPFADGEVVAEEGKSFALDRTGRSVGFENLDGLSVARIMLLGSGTVSTDPADYVLSVSADNVSWSAVTDFTLSTGTVAGKTALCVDTDVDAAYVKLTYVGQTVGAFTVEHLDTDLYAFSLEQVYDFGGLYEKAAVIGYADGDRAPANGAAAEFGTETEFVFDANYRSLTADLGEATAVNYIKLYDDDGQTRLAKQDLSIYVSDDNVTYTKIDDFDYRQDGRVLHLYNFTAAGRYVKVHQNHYENSNARNSDDGFDYYSTVKGSLQEMMSLYQMPLFSVYTDETAYPYGQGQWQYYKELSLEGTGDLVLLSYEELGLAQLVSEGKLQADFGDLRFTTTDGVLLHCYDAGNGFYVRAKENETILMFYGEPNASSVSDGAGTLQVDYGGKTFGPALGGDVHYAVLPDGRMIQIAYCGLEEEDGEELFMAISEDNGLTFGEPVQIADTPNNNAQSGGVLVLEDGTVMVTYMWAEKVGGYGSYMDPEQTNMPVYAIYSKDLESWSEPVQVSADYTYNLATTNPMQAANGDIYLPIATIVDNHGSVGIYVMRSQDGGQTWKQVSPLYQNENAYFEGGYAEPCVVELNEGTIRVYFRQGAGLETTMLGQITSYDNGETWTEVEQSQFYATCTQPVTYKLDSGRILLMWAGHNGTSAKTYQRMPVTVAYTDDNGETWHGYQEVSGRTLINIPFGHPMALQPDFCYAPDGSLTWAIWVRGSIYAPDGKWVSVRLEDFDRWMEENTGAFDDFEQASVVKGNYWYEMGPRVGVSEEYSLSGRRALRIKDASTIDTGMAVRNFMGTTKGELHVSLNYTSAASGLRLGLWECEPVHATDVGGMFALDISKSGVLSWVNADGETVATDAVLKAGQWYDLTMKFDVEAGTMDILVNGETVAQAACTVQQSIIAYFAAYSTGLTDTGTEFWLDDLYVIDSADADLALAAVSEEKQPAEKPEAFELYGANMKLGNDLSMNFYIKASDVIGEGWYAEIVCGGSKTVVVLNDSVMDDENYYKLTYPGFTAKEMTEEVVVTIYDAVGNAVSEPWTDSIRTYAMRILTKETATDADKTLMVDMLNYGAAAQTQFTYKTDDLANSLLTDAQKAYATETVELADNREKGVNYYGTSLNLKNNIQMNFYFTNVTADMTARISYTNHSGDTRNLEAAVVMSGDYGKVTVESMVVADVYELLTVEVLDSDGNVVAHVIDSVESYCSRTLDSQPLNEYLMKFAQSAWKSFHE